MHACMYACMYMDFADYYDRHGALCVVAMSGTHTYIHTFVLRMCVKTLCGNILLLKAALEIQGIQISTYANHTLAIRSMTRSGSSCLATVVKATACSSLRQSAMFFKCESMRASSSFALNGFVT
jgi:hypothetical protein